mmetsp:Transcript_52671/g.83565  ORF Transcript_52671/g.83565 Transcript_52671/m.83565 type:complete len:231 (+) Transcript_52671:85-777(+)
MYRPGEEDKAVLVQRVKEFQRGAPQNKEQWYSFCISRGTTNYDPNRHDRMFLTKFLSTVGKGAGSKGAVTSMFGAGLRTSSNEKIFVGNERIFVGGLPSGSTAELVRAHFARFGEVLEVDLKCGTSGSFRLFAYVTFASKLVAQQVLDNDRNVLAGTVVECRPAALYESLSSSATDAGFYSKKGTGSVNAPSVDMASSKPLDSTASLQSSPPVERSDESPPRKVRRFREA